MESRNIWALLLIAATIAVCTVTYGAEESATPAESSSAKTDLDALVGKINEKLKAGQRTADELAAELEAFDALLDKYPEKTEESARIALMRATLYLSVIRDEETGERMLTEVERDYPGTGPAKQAKDILFSRTPEGKAQAKKEAEEREANLAALIGKPAPELHFEWSSQEGLETLSDLKGRVVVLDFWATWCGPCISSFPQIREHVEHFKDAPVTFLGVTSIQGRVSNMGPTINTRGDPKKEFELMNAFMEQKNMTWDVVFSKEKVFNPEYFIRGIPYLAIIAPDGTIRHTGLHPGNRSADITGKIAALLEEFEISPH